MGKSQQSKNVNTDLNSQYQNYSSPNNQYQKYADMFGSNASESKDRSDSSYADLYSQFSDLAANGGVDENNKSRIRGSGVFDEFADTGGYSGKDIRDIRSRAGSGLSSYYDAIKDEMGRNTASTGINPGYVGQTQRLARDKGQALGDEALNIETSIKDKVNQGRQWGASGMSSAEQALLGLTNQGKGLGLSGLQHLRDSDVSKEDMYTTNMLKALGMNDDMISKLLQMRASYNPNESGFSSFMKDLSPIFGAAGGIFGSGVFGGGKKGIDTSALDTGFMGSYS